MAEEQNTDITNKAALKKRSFVESDFIGIKKISSKNNNLESILAALKDGADINTLDSAYYKRVASAFQIEDFSIYNNAAHESDIKALEFLESLVFKCSNTEKKAKDLILNAFKTNDFFAYRNSARWGRLQVLEYFENMGYKYSNTEQEAKQLMLEAFKSKNFDAYQSALITGQHNILEYYENRVHKYVNTKKEAKELMHDVYFSVYQNAAKKGNVKILEYLENRIYEYVSAIEVEQLNQDAFKTFSERDFLVYRQAASLGKNEALEYFENMVYKYSDEEQEAKKLMLDAIKAEKFFAYNWAVNGGHIKTLKYLERKVHKYADSEQEAKQLIANFIEVQVKQLFFCGMTPENSHTEVSEHLISHKLAPQEVKKLYGKEFASNYFKIKGVITPAPEDYGDFGQVYQYALVNPTLMKFSALNKKLPSDVVENIDYKKIIANHKQGVGSVLVGVLPQKSISEEVKSKASAPLYIVRWGDLNDVLSNINHKKASEIGDAISEISKYTAINLLAYKYLLNDRMHQLNILSEEGLEKELNKIQTTVIKYFMEQKTLPQMAKISEVWHKYRVNKVKTSHDGSTLRDFAEVGAWHQTLPEKEIFVTKPELAGWSIVNLTNSSDLMSEHHLLDHCVDGYVDKCKKGYQVFSVRYNGIAQTTMGFYIENEELKLDQNTGYKNRKITAVEQQVQDWFIEGVKSGEVKINLSKTGELPIDVGIPEFENKMGVKVESITVKRLQNNLDLLTSIARENSKINPEMRQDSKSSTKRDIYAFGHENLKANIDDFIHQIGLQFKTPKAEVQTEKLDSALLPIIIKN